MKRGHCVSVAAAEIKLAETERRVAEIRAEGAVPDWATPAQRDAAEFAVRKAIDAVGDEATRFQNARVAELLGTFSANTRRMLHLKAVIADPTRFVAVAEATRRLNEGDQLAAAHLFHGNDDALGGAALASVATGEAVAIALQAGTGEALAHTANLLRGQIARAKTLSLFEADPAKKLALFYEAQCVPNSDGSFRSYSDAEVKELVGD